MNYRSTGFLYGDAHHYRATQTVFALFLTSKVLKQTEAIFHLLIIQNQLDVFSCLDLPKGLFKSSIYEMCDVLKLEENVNFINFYVCPAPAERTF